MRLFIDRRSARRMKSEAEEEAGQRLVGKRQHEEVGGRAKEKPNGPDSDR